MASPDGAYVKLECGLSVHTDMLEAIAGAAKGTGVTADAFWAAFAAMLDRFGARNRALLRTRDAIQAQLDSWLLQRSGGRWDGEAYERFLREIGYLLPEGPAFKVQTDNVDAEIATQPGPQLVVPVDNARFLLNAANARWGSLLDAL